MGLLNSYESNECSAEEPVETLSEECLLGSDDCAFANFSFQLSIPSGASNINPAKCTKVTKQCGLTNPNFSKFALIWNMSDFLLCQKQSSIFKYKTF